MKIQILGTAAAEGWPAIFCTCPHCIEARKRGGKDLRTRASTLIDDQILIDFSADTYSNALRFGLCLAPVHTLVVTHHHEDHFYLDDIFMRMDGVFAHLYEGAAPTMTIYGNDRVIGDVQPRMGMFKTEEVKLVEYTPYTTYDLPNGYTFTPLTGLHDRRQLCCIILVTSPEGKSFLYGHDTGIFPEETFAYLKGRHLDLITYDCTNGPNAEGYNHMGFPDDIVVRKRLTELGCVDEKTTNIITHFSHNGGLLHKELEALATPEGFQVAYDGAIFTA